jgi:hypothetical protein
MDFGWKSSPLEALMSLTIRGDPLERMKAKEAAEGQAERIAEVWAEGIAEKAAEFLLWVLARRGLTVPAQLRERVLSCVDLEQLGVWLEKSASANSVEDVFPG